MTFLVSDKDQVKKIKVEAFCEPVKYLYPNLAESMPQIHDIFCYLLQLDYNDLPDYYYI
jgi:hypothetical protein